MAEKPTPAQSLPASPGPRSGANPPHVLEPRPKPSAQPDFGAFAGPLPLPAHFEHYEEVLPGAAERIVAMAEAEQRNRHAIEQHESLVATDLAKREAALQEASVNGELGLERLGMLLGFAATVIIVCGAIGFAVLAPDRIDKIGALIIGGLFGAGQLVVAYRKGVPPTKQGPTSQPAPTRKRKGR
jgi:uncharacterized membrane protein